MSRRSPGIDAFGLQTVTEEADRRQLADGRDAVRVARDVACVRTWCVDLTRGPCEWSPNARETLCLPVGGRTARDSVLVKGSTFWLELPTAPPAEHPYASDTVAASSRGTASRNTTRTH